VLLCVRVSPMACLPIATHGLVELMALRHLLQGKETAAGHCLFCTSGGRAGRHSCSWWHPVLKLGWAGLVYCFGTSPHSVLLAWPWLQGTLAAQPASFRGTTRFAMGFVPRGRVVGCFESMWRASRSQAQAKAALLFRAKSFERQFQKGVTVDPLLDTDKVRATVV